MKPKNVRLPKISLRLFNNLLTILVAGLALYIIVLPFLPQLHWWIRHDTPVKAIVSDKSDNPDLVRRAGAVDALFIPSMELEQTIWGGDKTSLAKGVWHVAHTSTPDKGGNTVLVGHRFTYKEPAGVLYHLDKVRKGDPITVHWEGKIYNYKVTESKTVSATEVSIEDNTAEPQLTIYTCTPLGSVSHRLVVIAKPAEESP